jgi:uncharacterized protein (TIRG00374 family)
MSAVAATVTDAGQAKPKSSRNLGMRVFNLVIMVVGGVALWWMIRETGVSQLKTMILSVGAWAGLIFALDVASLCTDAAALHTFMRPEERMIPYWRVLGAHASGRAINVLTPGGALGEPVKLGLLMQHAPRSRVLSSLVLFNLTHTYISIAVMIIGTPIMLLAVDIPPALKIPIFVAFGVLAAGAIGLGVVIHRGAVSTVVGAMRRARFISAERSTKWKEKLVDVDRHIRELHTNRSAGTWKGILWVGLSKLIMWTASVTLLLAVDAHVTPLLVIGILSLGVIIRWVASIVPMGLGVQDGSNYGLYELLGSTGTLGMAVTMLDRVRSLAVAMAGLLALAAMQLDRYLQNLKIQRKIRELKVQHADEAGTR